MNKKHASSHPQARLFEAISRCDPKDIREAIEDGASVHAPDDKGRPALVRLVCQTDATPDLVRLLLDAGADPNEPDGGAFRLTPLEHVMSQSPRNAELALVLLDSGPDLSRPRRNSTLTVGQESAMECVWRPEFQPLLPWFLDRGLFPRQEKGQFGVLPSAIRSSHSVKSMLALLLAAGFSPDGQEGESERPLESAFHCKSLVAAEQLILAGADPYLPGIGGAPMIERALASPNPEQRDMALAVLAFYEKHLLGHNLPSGVTKVPVFRL